jgi:hypothetical protein
MAGKGSKDRSFYYDFDGRQYLAKYNPEIGKYAIIFSPDSLNPVLYGSAWKRQGGFAGKLTAVDRCYYEQVIETATLRDLVWWFNRRYLGYQEWLKGVEQIGD